MRGFRKGKDHNDILLGYLSDNPTGKWKGGFKEDASKEEMELIYDEIYADQHGLCAYCEISLKWPTTDFVNDFRVEHFHPENCGDDESHNYSLDWNNLLGCCHGGSQKTARSFNGKFPGASEQSCDVPKGNKILDEKILNPLQDLNVNESVFSFKENGEILVSDQCPENIRLKAEGTIKELNLDCLRLRWHRSEIISDLQARILSSITDPEDLDSISLVVEELKKDLIFPASPRREFYSTIDWYLSGQI
ncbi:retron Ec78 anti-phage system effector HNH endonuclease PtuB [Pantoea sp. KXB45]|uniref:retron Ec78 anti-phage system effector HNH endonuclease PtuB n=1 Tax=Pantoea sp. KXB45 TaxID=3402309 RepID=UPI003AB33E71